MNQPVQVLVIGSLNMDLVTETERAPQVGETIMGSDFRQLPGGKGANQAVAAARLGAEVIMIGAVGNDDLGDHLIRTMAQEGIKTNAIRKVADRPSGIAQITLAQGDNRIIVVPGANLACTPEWVDQHQSLFQQADIVVLQLEVPLNTVIRAVELANQYDVPVVLNPAPAQALPAELYHQIAYLTPNETELAYLIRSLRVQDGLDQDVVIQEKEGFALLLEQKVPHLLMTVGAEGVFYASQANPQLQHHPAFPVAVVDTTGAGDAFNGAFAVAIAEGMSMEKSIRFASAAAALKVQKFGAQAGMPTRDQVEAFLEQHDE
ncbi:ribokinase [Rubeoparvulum massiliense]|uniref:ribokinase n=1 Tax=Rubeoparvulum massiliense TaxID=1631346 RepID=UPI00065DE89B|nr:ribokinase [Rubeoparvulum massiliense]